MRDPWALGRLERQMTFAVSMVKDPRFGRACGHR
jgi:hypothetical protein